jgi:D-alanyl-D-alanine carboxypeptidase
MPTLENKPENTKPMVHQYWDRYNWDSYDIDVSVDLYGGGGIACSTHDLAIFFYKLFHSEVIKNPEVFKLIFTEIPTKDPQPSYYYFGLSSKYFQGIKSYGHGGFWGTEAVYIPALNTSISVFILVKEKSNLRDEIISLIIREIQNLK